MIEERKEPLGYADIFRFWLPLGLMWMIMAIEQPAITAVIARLGDAEKHLAAFGVTMSLALVIESPVLQMLSAATALAKSRTAYLDLLRFMHLLAISLTVLHLLLAATPLGRFVFDQLLGVPPEVAEVTRAPLLIMTPFTAAVGYRRLWQGVLIRNGRTKAIALTTVIRLGATAIVLLIGLRSGSINGSSLAALAITVGVVVGAIVSYIYFRRWIPDSMADGDTSPSRPTAIKTLLAFYIPLAMTSSIYLLGRPIVTYGIARSENALRSLAVWPVLNGFLFLFNSLAISMQEVVIALLEQNPANRRRIAKFTTALATTLTALFFISIIAPIRNLWFGRINGLPDYLVDLTRWPLLVLTIVPAISTLKSWYRGQYVTNKRTGTLSSGVILYTIALLACVVVVPSIVRGPGALMAAVFLLFAQLVENFYLRLRLNSPNRRRDSESNRLRPG